MFSGSALQKKKIGQKILHPKIDPFSNSKYVLGALTANPFTAQAACGVTRGLRGQPMKPALPEMKILM
jgi:hypothetical protein